LAVFESISKRFLPYTVVSYIWDDHDYGPNNSDGSSTSREAARLSYQKYVPRYPFLNNREGDVPIYQSYIYGRIKFILTDLRSEANITDMMSDEQENWFFQELLGYQNWDLMVWVSTRPWIGPEIPGEDFWGGFHQQRRRIANFISENSINNLVMISGDAHMVAIDDGSNSDYSDNSGAGFPVFQAAALDRWGTTKGGPFSQGCYTYTEYWTEQYGLMDVYYNDDNNTCITWTGYRTISETEKKLLVTWQKCIPTVKNGTAGNGDCKSEIMPVFMWIQLIFIYGSMLIMLVLFMILFCSNTSRNKKGHFRRVIIVTTFIILNILSIIITLVYWMQNYWKPAKSPYLPYDVSWIGLGLLILFFVDFLVEFYLIKKDDYQSVDDEEDLRKIIS